MATKAAHKRLTREYASIAANPPEFICAHPSEANILEWHYVLTGPPNTPYAGGQYWGTLVFPSDYPFAPPAIRMHTPSGRFRCSERLCLSISDFHPRSFNPAWEVSTILLGVLSFMTSEEMTTGSVSATDAERRALASMTRWWNSTGGGSTRRTLSSPPPQPLQQDGSQAQSPAQSQSQQQPQPQQNSNSRGFGAIKAGDGGKRFREQWPELDEENWKWMEQHRIDPQTGKSLIAQPKRPNCSPGASALTRRAGASGGLNVMMDGGRGVGVAGQSWLRRNKWYVVVASLLIYGSIARLLREHS